jgi:hypothetical protein
MSSTIPVETVALETTSKRPFWLGVLCVLLWLYEFFVIATFVLATLLSYAFHDDGVVIVYPITMAYLVIIPIAFSIGLWRMKKWGGLLYAVFAVFDCTLTILGSQSTPIKMFPISLVIDSLLHHTISYESFILILNINCYVPLPHSGWHRNIDIVAKRETYLVVLRATQ